MPCKAKAKEMKKAASLSHLFRGLLGTFFVRRLPPHLLSSFPFVNFFFVWAPPASNIPSLFPE